MKHKANPHSSKNVQAPKAGHYIWGFHAARAAWLNPKRGITRALATDAGLKGFEDVVKQNTNRRPKIEVVDKTVLDRMCTGDAVHQGLVLQVEPLPEPSLRDLIAQASCTRLVMLDGVTDPHNVGAIMRSACAFGASGVIVQDRNAPNVTGVLAKAASGAADVIPLVQETNLSRTIELLKEHDFFVVGLDERGVDLGKLPDYERLCLVMGAEGAGLRRLVGEHCDVLTSLPTGGPVPTLNVSNAAAVALYALRQKSA